MHEIGDMIVYGTHGVCTILGVEERTVDRKKVEYFVLEPMEQPGARFYVPTQNQAAVSKLRKLLTAQQLDAILHSDEVRQNSWIADEGRRKQYYRDLITSGDRAAILRMVNSLHRHKQEQAEAGRKFHLCDENFLREAEKLLSAEFSMVLGIPADQVGTYVLKAISKES